ncbi:hypothetical protein ACFPH6_08240 [Streptomyces xiangluensis]|uniref:Uncharacterized protein n=1 Tax=Streptomyces xiangluensis TaxID=2665720 RepID=A0ABV8YKD8_9ACTN
MLELYRTALRLRRDNPALGDGTMTWLDAPAGVLAFRFKLKTLPDGRTASMVTLEGQSVGDPLTDASHIQDGYRFRRLSPSSCGSARLVTRSAVVDEAQAPQ